MRSPALARPLRLPLTSSPPPCAAASSFSNANSVLDTRPFLEEDARDCLDLYVRSTWFARRNLAHSMVITEILPSNTYVVQLETFVESRVLVKTYRKLQPVNVLDDANCGPVPGAWDVQLPLPTMYQDADVSMALPHTEELRYCHSCSGAGQTRCNFCNGNGRSRCGMCNATGVRTVTRSGTDGSARSVNESCSSCNGAGSSLCHTCNGSGRCTCSTCGGTGQLIHYIRLDVSYKNNRTRAVIDAADQSITCVLPQ